MSALNDILLDEVTLYTQATSRLQITPETRQHAKTNGFTEFAQTDQSMGVNQKSYSQVVVVAVKRKKGVKV